MLSYHYRDSHVKDKTVSPTVLSLTWESSYLGKTVFILNRDPGSLPALTSSSWSLSLSSAAAAAGLVMCGMSSEPRREHTCTARLNPTPSIWATWGKRHTSLQQNTRTGQDHNKTCETGQDHNILHLGHLTQTAHLHGQGQVKVTSHYIWTNWGKSHTTQDNSMA